MRHFNLTATAIMMLAGSPMARAAAPLQGIYALAQGQPSVSATLAATPGRGSHLTVDIAMAAMTRPHTIRRYETELSKQLHVIAISSDFRTFLHAHGDRPGPDGHFHIALPLPHPGLYHVYADAVPAGLGQQVMRFEVTVGHASAATPIAPKPPGLSAADGRYSVRFAPFTLQAGQESQLSLHVSRDDQPAPDLTPFLGVAAHAVFIDTADLTYVHVHAAPAASHPDAPAGMESMAGMGAPLPPGSHLPPDLTLHILAPKAGSYRLWLQFIAGGQVRTVPFAVSVM